MGENSPVETLLRSSADLDHLRRDMFRRSPRPSELCGTTGLGGVLGDWNCGISMDPAGLADKSSTDLVNGRMS